MKFEIEIDIKFWIWNRRGVISKEKKQVITAIKKSINQQGYKVFTNKQGNKVTNKQI